MYPNLKAELARHDAWIVDIANLLGCSRKSAENKFFGRSQFTISEAKMIRDKWAPSFNIEVLFETKKGEEPHL